MERAELNAASLDPAAGRLLVAAPMLSDPNFARTIVLLLDVDPLDPGAPEDGGVLGVVLNRPGELLVDDVLGDWTDTVAAPGVLFTGGPVSPETALAVGRVGGPGPDAPVGWQPMFDRTGLVDLDAPSEIVGPALSGMRIYAGYAGWSRGQLRDEIAEGAWYVVEGRAEDHFAADPGRLWSQVLRRQPGDLAWLATYPEDPTQN